MYRIPIIFRLRYPWRGQGSGAIEISVVQVSPLANRLPQPRPSHSDECRLAMQKPRCIDRVVAIEFELDELSIEVVELRKEPVEQVGGSRNLRRRRIHARKALDAWHGLVTTVGSAPAFG